MNALAAPDDTTLALCELSNDLFFGKIPPPRLEYYLAASLAFGREAASLHAGRDIEALYREEGIALTKPVGKATAFGVTLRGQAILGRDGCRVEVYEDSLRSLAEHSAYGGRPALSLEEALRLHLAHEFFHYLEFRAGSTVAERLDRVETFRCWRLVRRARIGRCSEIAAHAFAKDLLGLPVLPNFYDYLYLIGVGKMRVDGFNQKITGLRQRLHN